MRQALSLLVAVEAVMAAGLVVLLADNTPGSGLGVIILLIVAAAALMWSRNFADQAAAEQKQRRRGSEPEALNLLRSLQQKLRLPSTFSLREDRKALYLLADAFIGWYQSLEVDHNLPLAERVAAVNEALKFAAQHGSRSEPRRAALGLKSLIRRLGRSLGVCALCVYIRRMQHRLRAAQKHAAEIERQSGLLQGEFMAQQEALESLKRQLCDSTRRHDRETQTILQQLELARQEAAGQRLQNDQQLKAAQHERAEQERLRNDLGGFLAARQRELAETEQPLPLIDRSGWAPLLAGLREFWRLFEERQAAAKQDLERACRAAVARIKQECAQLCPASVDPDVLTRLWAKACSENERSAGWPAAFARCGASPARSLEDLRGFLESLLASSRNTVSTDRTTRFTPGSLGGSQLFS